MNRRVLWFFSLTDPSYTIISSWLDELFSSVITVWVPKIKKKQKHFFICITIKDFARLFYCKTLANELNQFTKIQALVWHNQWEMPRKVLCPLLKVSRDSTKPKNSKMITEQKNNFFLEKMWKTLFLYKVIEGQLWMNEFEWNCTFKALKHRTPKDIKICLNIFCFSTKPPMLSPFGLLSSAVCSTCRRTLYKAALCRHSFSIEVLQIGLTIFICQKYSRCQLIECCQILFLSGTKLNIIYV